MKLRYVIMAFFFLFAIITYLPVQAQYDKGFFDWDSHLPQKRFLHLDQSVDYIYGATPYNVMKMSKEDHAVQFYSKVSGLSDVEVATIAHLPTLQKLFIAYRNGNIDLLDDYGNVENIPDLLINSSLIGNKKINAIYSVDNNALLACSFGILLMDCSKLHTIFTTYTGFEVYDITQLFQYYYAATEDGIYRFDTYSGKNPGYLGSWEHMGSAYNLPEVYESRHIENHNGVLYATIDNDLYQLKNNFELVIESEGDKKITSMRSSLNTLVITNNEDWTSQTCTINSEGELTSWYSSCAAVCTDAIRDVDGRIWYGDEWHYLKYQQDLGGNCQQYDFDSPYSQNNREIRIKNGDLYVASGGINENFLFDSNRDGFYIRQNNSWSNFNGNVLPIINQKDMINFLVVEPHPTQNKVYAGAFPGGILELNLDDGSTQVFNSDNSVVQGPSINVETERVSEIKFDQNENMWATCYLADQGLVVRTKDGDWHSFNIGNRKNLGAIEFDNFGYLWIQLAGSSGGVLIFDYNQTIEDKSDDRYMVFNRNNSTLNSNRVLSLKKDLDGNMWVGTDAGPAVFDCGDPFQGCSGSIKKVLQDSIPAILLQTEVITSMTVDGGNRKWLATANGIFVQSPDGNTQVYQFSAEESELFANNILDIEFDGQNGEVFIATSLGLQSIRINSTLGTQKFVEDAIQVFPNPVRPEYNGLIAIQGLAANADVKIVNQQGELVYEGQAIGGTATWDGYDFSGHKVSSGVYTAFFTVHKNLDKPNTSSTKFMIIR